jgi:Fe-S cluster biogenesis protein NfuA
MNEPLKIRGELTPDPQLCKFHLDVPLAEPGWTIAFHEPQASQGSSLADALFAIPGIVHVTVREHEIILRKDGTEPWPELATQVVPAIQEAVGGPGPLVSAAAMEAVRSAPVDKIEALVAQLFEQHINPALANHGGFARLVRIEDRDVYLEMGGGCQGCAASQATLRQGIETAIRQVAPQVRDVVDVTNHAAGANPYFKE